MRELLAAVVLSALFALIWHDDEVQEKMGWAFVAIACVGVLAGVLFAYRVIR